MREEAVRDGTSAHGFTFHNKVNSDTEVMYSSVIVFDQQKYVEKSLTEKFRRPKCSTQMMCKFNLTLFSNYNTNNSRLRYPNAPNKIYTQQDFC